MEPQGIKLASEKQSVAWNGTSTVPAPLPWCRGWMCLSNEGLSPQTEILLGLL